MPTLGEFEEVGSPGPLQAVDARPRAANPPAAGGRPQKRRYRSCGFRLRGGLTHTSRGLAGRRTFQSEKKKRRKKKKSFGIFVLEVD